jgi:acetyl esterase/lipase
VKTVLATLLVSVVFCAAAPEPLALWPKGAPGEINQFGEERDMTKPTDNQIAGRPVVRLGNVTNATLTIFPAPKDKDTGTAVVVFPGGGYHIIAYDLEGTEVCEWLNSIGVTAVLVKYRVPKRPNQPRHAAPLQDAQRAVGLVRSRAAELGLEPNRIGVLGFSAGAHLAATLAANTARTYPPVDAADAVSCRPDFMFLIYPGYLTLKDQGHKVAPEVAVTPNTPPTFLLMTQDDPIGVETVLHYSLALKQSGVPFELHVYPTGGHGYGLRRTENPLTAWPDRAEDWMRSRGLLRR